MASNSEPIVAWIIPHTHDDVGWIKTVDEYYMGEVQWILDTTVRALLDNPARKFTYVEIAFFKRWWNEQNEATKKQVQGLVANGQFKFNLGGWCMADEATPHYEAEINQLTEGHKFIQREFGDGSLPGVGWHIDPFGHSSVYPSILSSSGMRAFGLNRINYELKDKLKSNKTLEFMWRGSSSLGNETQIFAHIMDSHYCTPGECGYDGGKVLQWDNKMVTYKMNIVEQGEEFVKMIKARNSWYRHSHQLIPYGCDFSHQNAHRSFANMDKLIDYVNSNSSLGVIAKYGHFDDYVDAVLATKTKWEIFEEVDFFPYISSPHAWWTGYYTSRPKLKGYVRSRDSVLRAGEVLSNIMSKGIEDEKALRVLRMASGVSQHHDGVSGTEKQHVADDYTTFLEMGTKSVNNVIEERLNLLINNGSSTGKPSLSTSSDDSVAALNATNAVSIVVFNSLSWARSSFVAVDCSRTDLAVFNSDFQLVPSQINPVYVAKGSNPNSNQRLFFLASVPAMGFATYFIRVNKTVAIQGQVKPFSEMKTISNNNYRVDFSETNGMMTKVSNLLSGKNGRVEETLVQYRPSDGRDGLRPSGAYVFRPMQDSRFGIGKVDGTGVFKTVKYSFVESYSSTPKVFISPRGENYDDTFTMSVRSVDRHTLHVNVHRGVDEEKGWGQNLRADYLALVDIPQSGFQMGSSNIAAQKSPAFVIVKIVFPSAFSRGSSPRLIACVRGSEDVDDTFIVTSYDLLPTGAYLNITRLDGDSWSQSLVVDWLAWPENAKAATYQGQNNNVLSRFVQGSQHLGKSLKRFKEFTVQMPGNQVGDPVIIAQVRGAPGANTCQTYIVTIRDANLIEFKLNVDAGRNKGRWDDDLYVDWIAFSPKHYEAPVIAGLPKSGNVITGPYIQEIQQLYRDNYGKTTRLYSDPSQKSKDLGFIEMDYSIGPLDKGAELISRFTTDLKTNDHFYTDSNGLEMQKRIRDPTRDEPIAGNYYPSASCSFLRDNSDPNQMTLLHDRTHGVGSRLPGQIEVMLHRRCVKDDGYGVGEVLNENDHIDPSFYMLFDGPTNSSLAHHHLALHQHFPLMPLFDLTNSPMTWASRYITHGTALKEEVPPNLHILSLKTYEKQLYLRLQHLFEANEHPTWSKPVTVDTGKLFDPKFLQVNTLIETLLTATTVKHSVTQDNNVVTLNARQIKTFAVQ